jgi:hypothetical protein
MRWIRGRRRSEDLRLRFSERELVRLEIPGGGDATKAHATRVNATSVLAI